MNSLRRHRLDPTKFSISSQHPIENEFYFPRLTFIHKFSLILLLLNILGSEEGLCLEEGGSWGGNLVDSALGVGAVVRQKFISKYAYS